MTKELRAIVNTCREDSNLSPVSKIEIYSFLIHLTKTVLSYRPFCQS